MRCLGAGWGCGRRLRLAVTLNPAAVCGCHALSGLGDPQQQTTQGVALGWYITPFQGWDAQQQTTQGVALGWYVTPFQGWGTLNNRLPRALPWVGMSRPFRAAILNNRPPRALPWAGMSRPFRAGGPSTTDYPGRCPGLVCHAPSGLGCSTTDHPGRCPGLVCHAPSGLGCSTTAYPGHCLGLVCHALSGLGSSTTDHPGALPWAGISRPCGADG
jgi:hypothetical protein